MSHPPPLIVLIEDHRLVRLSQRLLCEMAGYEVVEIEGPAALAGYDALQAPPDIIIADYDLGPAQGGPRQTGIDLARAIMRQAGRTIPTLVLSGSLGAHSLPAAREAGLPLMFKPATEAQLLGWIARAIGER